MSPSVCALLARRLISVRPLSITRVLLLTAILTVVIASSAASSSAFPTGGNSGFETPDLAGAFYTYQPATGAGQPWVFSPSAGIARSVFIAGQPNISVVGTTYGQFAFVQNAGASMTQSINFSTPGTYALHYMEAGREFHVGSGNLTYTASLTSNVGGITVLSNSRTTSTNQPFTGVSIPFTVAVPGDYTLSFAGTASPDGDDMGIFDNVNITVPTAANVSVSGRVLTQDGRGVRNAMVVLTEPSGYARRVRTGAQGYYQFDGVPAGPAYVLSVDSKQYVFAPRIIAAEESMNGLDLVGEPSSKSRDR